jgi:predicted MFS family arabinose efflux permease
MRKYVFLVGSVFFLFIGIFMPLFYIPTFAITNGMNEMVAGYLVAIINAASIPGRIIPGILGDKFGRVNCLFAAGLATSLIIFCWPEVRSDAGIIAYSIAFGFTSGAIISGGSVVFSLCPQAPEDIGTFMGMGISVASLAILIGPPITGAFLDRYRGFLQISIFGGVMTMAGTGLALLSKTQFSEGLLGRV